MKTPFFLFPLIFCSLFLLSTQNKFSKLFANELNQKSTTKIKENTNKIQKNLYDFTTPPTSSINSTKERDLKGQNHKTIKLSSNIKNTNNQLLKTLELNKVFVKRN